VTFGEENMDRRDDMMRHFPTILARWKGGDVQLWSLTTSHPTLVLLVTKDDEPGCLLIHCAMPERIEAPRRWTGCDFCVVKADDMFDLVDRTGNARICDCGISLAEHPTKPWEQS